MQPIYLIQIVWIASRIFKDSTEGEPLVRINDHATGRISNGVGSTTGGLAQNTYVPCDVRSLNGPD